MGAQPIVTTPPDLPSLPRLSQQITAAIDDIVHDLAAHAWTCRREEAA